jgi:hypothetical protein
MRHIKKFSPVNVQYSGRLPSGVPSQGNRMLGLKSPESVPLRPSERHFCPTSSGHPVGESGNAVVSLQPHNTRRTRRTRRHTYFLGV